MDRRITIVVAAIVVALSVVACGSETTTTTTPASTAAATSSSPSAAAGGGAWKAQDSGTNVDFADVDFADATHGWAVGHGGTILATKDGGGAWKAQDSGTNVDLADVDFADATHGWAVGLSGAILATKDGGATWSAQSSGSSTDLWGVAFSDARHGWAVGDKGTILATKNGGGASASPTPAEQLALGDPYQGGVLAYILQAGDPGYVAGEEHGLIAAKADQSGGIQWGREKYWYTEAPGGTSTDIGSGAANTDKIIALNGAGNTYAAGLARSYNGGGYSDWYLPSRDELNKLYLNQAAIGGFNTTLTNWYWSSSEGEGEGEGEGLPAIAWFQDFVDGFQSSNLEEAPSRVRAVRAF